MTKDEFEDAKTLWKMIYAYHCFRNVENACSFILNEKMDETTRFITPLSLQSTFYTASLFKHSNVVGKLADDIVPPNTRQLHELLLKKAPR